MAWFFIALIGPFLYATTNHIDKILIEKFFKQSGVGTLVLFSSLLSILALPVFFIADPSILEVDLISMLILLGAGTLNVMVLWFYLIALESEEASITIIFYQLVPVFAYFLGFIILGEVLTRFQLLAMAIIILGTSVVAFEVDAENKFKLRKKTILPMLAASLCWAASEVVFKFVALEENLWRSLFWEHVALVLVGVLVFIFVRKYRINFILAIKENSRKILSLNVLNEVLYMIGNFAVAYAYMMVPVALVLVTESFQPIFVLIIGVILTIFFPKVAVEKIEAKYIWQKIIAIVITGIGAYMLSVAV